MKILLIILGCIYFAGTLNALRKGNRKQAVWQLVWFFVVAAVLATTSGCATRQYVDAEVSLAQNDARRRTLDSHSDLLEELDRVDQRIDTLRKSVLSSSEIRRQQYRAYWIQQLDAQQAALDGLRKEILPTNGATP